VQVLTALGHQHLALGWGELVVAREPLRQLQACRRRLQARLGLAQRAGQEAIELLTAADQVGEAPLRLQLQGLLQGAEPTAMGI
jgi:hypothetical protein